MNVGIVGLGLIGGSMARSIKSRTDHCVWGIDINQESMELARLCGAIDAPLTPERLPTCDLLLLALRPGIAVEWLTENGASLSGECTGVDLCGVKRQVVSSLSALARTHGFTYIGGHPMAGRERGGFTSSREDLYQGASMILTPGSGPDIALLEQLKSFFLDLGFARVVFTTPEVHDRIIAYTSQLAHITSSAYVRSPTALERRGFSAGSFRDMTRVARLDEDMWTELCLQDADYLAQELRGLIDRLEEYRDALEQGDAERLRALFRDGREKKAAAGGN